MGYYVDLRTIGLDGFKQWLSRIGYFIPSRRMLAEHLDARLGRLAALGAHDLQELLDKLKSKKQIAGCAQACGLPADYLTHLARELKGFTATNRKLKDFAFLKRETLAALQAKGVSDTAGLFELTAGPRRRDALGRELAISRDEVTLLAKLADLCRLRYVSPAFAHLLASSPYDAVAKIQKADPNQLCEALASLNAGQAFFKGKLGLKDMEFLAAASRFFPPEAEP